MLKKLNPTLASPQASQEKAEIREVNATRCAGDDSWEVSAGEPDGLPLAPTRSTLASVPSVTHAERSPHGLLLPGPQRSPACFYQRALREIPTWPASTRGPSSMGLIHVLGTLITHMPGK
ncbi:hypothetical protein NHX12_010920 [Muraenolepis orangiensis]|uniref:Uncharacterized protein n=1 Tax=Muraenolepis orangiensis TaxID=630683 RepID=A0A9Q0I578_9TELE|nr:hypothetical protein NHX12_010920 [Muraenolepis orangiensis]